MKPVNFEQATTKLVPSGKVYSGNVIDVKPLNIWTDGEQCVSCWRLSWRERLSVLFFGRVWLSLLTGKTQPPAYLEASKNYFKTVFLPPKH